MSGRAALMALAGWPLPACGIAFAVRDATDLIAGFVYHRFGPVLPKARCRKWQSAEDCKQGLLPSVRASACRAASAVIKR